ncbi:hypothetical protein DIPPA_08805 [Diplonema papillatum]|nr:hypothetical protein DIPPA_20362 [Diplonema papillatum]KAJ9443248.1 hypothetical protein DIPPA_18847 [Diplonema papillatum]KAJ9453605.1 hypothetical protein DIPPA_28749 [Diplonema papillatum]KAJ9455187.1 hypothetical protein DIPPA_31534 [Diplonema papillatum]KAJ9463371.1 hypothetical protein DIPPA_08805 [Diplonema papillatum]
MWLQLKLEKGELQTQSARQYMTYRRMLSIDPTAAFRRTLSRELKEYERRALTSRTLVGNQQVEEAVREMTGLYRAALATQWSLGARLIDLIRLETKHILLCPRDQNLVLVMLVNGKTDQSGRGQPLLLQRTGRFVRWMLDWWNARLQLGEKYMFYPDLRTTRYNMVLRARLDLTSHGLRHSALTWVARFSELGEQAAQVVGRHKSVETTRQYIPHHLWGAAQDSAAPLSLLQK